MSKFVCDNCGAQYSESTENPEVCKICSDERQYVPESGQKWTTLEEMLNAGFENQFKVVEPNVYSIKTYPQVGIGQNAYFITTEHGNYLWDCITYLDAATISRINELGGLKGIILSHPHYYSTIVEWADAFDCSIYIHEADQEWVTRDSNRYVFWEGKQLQLTPDVEVLNVGGHFEGSSVLLWNKGANGKGTLFVGDTIFIVPAQGWVSFLYSHPNRIPLPAFEVQSIVDALSERDFDSIYGAFDNGIIQNGKEAVIKSAKRYIYHVERKPNDSRLINI